MYDILASGWTYYKASIIISFSVGSDPKQEDKNKKHKNDDKSFPLTIFWKLYALRSWNTYCFKESIQFFNF